MVSLMVVTTKLTPATTRTYKPQTTKPHKIRLLHARWSFSLFFLDPCQLCYLPTYVRGTLHRCALYTCSPFACAYRQQHN